MPARNIVIHTGINDINCDNRKPKRVLIKLLEKKCLDIQTVYPKSRIFISLLLPTKLPHLNRSVKEFNDMILEMVHKNKRLNIIDKFALLSDSNGCLDDNYGRFDKVTHQL